MFYSNTIIVIVHLENNKISQIYILCNIIDIKTVKFDEVTNFKCLGLLLKSRLPQKC